jgi:hypothetical protein
MLHRSDARRIESPTLFLAAGGKMNPSGLFMEIIA